MTTTLNDIDGFIQSLNLPQESKVLFQTFGDCHSFYITCYGRNDCITDDLLDYREKKLEESNITLDMFLDMCYNDILSAFETTFLQAFTNEQIVMIDYKLRSNHTDLETIYNGFQKNPNKNILKYVL